MFLALCNFSPARSDGLALIFIRLPYVEQGIFLTRIHKRLQFLTGDPISHNLFSLIHRDEAFYDRRAS